MFSNIHHAVDHISVKTGISGKKVHLTAAKLATHKLVSLTKLTQKWRPLRKLNMMRIARISRHCPIRSSGLRVEFVRALCIVVHCAL